MVVGLRSPLSAHTAALASPDGGRLAPAMPPPCLIVNPRSFSAARGLAAQATALALAEGAEVVTIDSPAGLRATVEAILARRQRQVMVLGGDGTVCAIVDQLSKLPPGAWVPDLLVLPGGRTNLTAADLLPGEGALAVLRRALRLSRESGWERAVEERCALRIEQAPAPPRHGFFVAGALIDGVIRQCHRHRVERQREGRPSAPTPLYLLWLGLRALVGRSGLRCPPLRIDAGPCGTQQGACRLLLVSTLMHRAGLFNPYAPRGQGEVRVSAVSREAPRFWRSLPRLLTGRYAAAMGPAAGYLSGRCERLEISGLAGYMLDGEPVEADPSRPVLITAGPRLRFLKP